jgi:hypothetical protein
MSTVATDAEGQARLGAFLQGLQEFGWAVGRNVRIDVRWPEGDTDEIRKHAAELATVAPDVILATGSATVGPLLQATRPCQLFLSVSSIQLVPATLRTWRDRVPILLDLHCLNTA